MSLDQIAASTADAGLTDPAVYTKLLAWALLNMNRQTAEYAQAAAKANQVATVAATNADIEAKQREVDAIDAAITSLLS